MVSILSKGGEKVKFDKWEEITEELRAIGKLHGKMFSRICQDMTVEVVSKIVSLFIYKLT